MPHRPSESVCEVVEIESLIDHDRQCSLTVSASASLFSVRALHLLRESVLGSADGSLIRGLSARNGASRLFAAFAAFAGLAAFEWRKATLRDRESELVNTQSCSWVWRKRRGAQVSMAVFERDAGKRLCHCDCTRRGVIEQRAKVRSFGVRAGACIGVV